MSRRPSLPGAAELFRATGAVRSVSTRTASRTSRQEPAEVAAREGVSSLPSLGLAAAAPKTDDEPAAARPVRRKITAVGGRRPSGRQRHEEKITVYCSAEELLDLETARLTLRGEHGLVVDRGRIVREAVAVVLADLEAEGEDSILVRRLRES
jgi:hypothetical protein